MWNYVTNFEEEKKKKTVEVYMLVKVSIVMYQIGTYSVSYCRIPTGLLRSVAVVFLEVAVTLLTWQLYLKDSHHISSETFFSFGEKSL